MNNRPSKVHFKTGGECRPAPACKVVVSAVTIMVRTASAVTCARCRRVLERQSLRDAAEGRAVEQDLRRKRERAAHARGWRMARAVCTCGHTGDGPGSLHADSGGYGGIGAGGCRAARCPCKRFTWARWRPKYKAYLARGPAQGEEP